MQKKKESSDHIRTNIHIEVRFLIEDKLNRREEYSCPYFQLTFIIIYIVNNNRELGLSMINSMRRTMTVQGERVTVLKVPWFPQSDSDWKCFVCSLKMCLEYFKNEYNNDIIRQNTPNLDIETLMKITHTRKNTGTPTEGICKKLEKAGLPFKFQLKSSSFPEIEEKLNVGLPAIVIYNGSYLKDERRGPSHAGVVIGMRDDDLILNNPWFGAIYLVDKFKFERAWELEYYQALLIDPVLSQIQTSLEDA